ncbi:hypothetical protein MNBD_GAMMA16-1329 [hydrothermal vent metagenome]|uniref:FCP1 homology domain-containing protein n=1 Tax=hydrothermal vent metagenome TaxID=652676 RepID=A0A3B0ZPV1_9ZZZZ
MSTLNEYILLFDIDGVLAMDGDVNNQNLSEIISLHPNIVEVFQNITFPVAILTHRSRREAEQILSALKINRKKLVGCFTAQDLLSSALLKHQYRTLLKQGLKKSFILPLLEDKYGFKKENIAMVDDRPENLSVLMKSGVGLTMLAPHVVFRSENSVMSFDLEQVISIFKQWVANHDQKTITTALTNKQRYLGGWSQTGMDIEMMNKTFIYCRRAVRKVRKSIAQVIR